MLKELSEIHLKLELFTKKYYKNKIIRGGLLFILLLSSLFLLLVFSEYLGHFSIALRTIIFFIAVAVLMLSFSVWVLKPLFAFYRIGASISKFQINEILENHFPELKDQLKNILELENIQEKGFSKDLIFEAIRQKSENIRLVPFTKAINIKKNIKYVRFLVLPSTILLVLYFYSPKVLSEGTERMVNFNKYYEKPSPFKVILENDSLEVLRGENLLLKVHTEGLFVPNPIYISFGGTKFILSKDSENGFSYELKNVNQSFNFVLEAENYQTKPYQVDVLPNPKILNFSVKIKPPLYTLTPEQTMDNNGDFIVPEGSVVEWNFKTKDIETLLLKQDNGTLFSAHQNDNIYSFQTQLKTNFAYSVLVSNTVFKENEVFSFLAQIIPDEYPGVFIQNIVDSLNPTVYYFKGQASDDYGIEKIKFCYQFESSKQINKIELPLQHHDAIQEFYYAYDFKDLVVSGQKLSYYFEVWDNDEINGSKSTKSRLFDFYLPSQKEVEKIEDEASKAIKDKLQQTQDLAKELQEDVKKLKKDLVEKETNSWQINKKLSQISEKQSQLEQLMQEVAKENEKSNELMKHLKNEDQKILEKQKQIEELMSQLMDEEMKKLMDEINKLMKELNKDQLNELTEKMDMTYEDLSKQLDRNLEQMKRFEVEKKMQQSIDDLKKLAEDHEQLSKETEKEALSKQDLENKQQEHKEKLDDIAKKLEQTLEKNKALDEPLKLEDFNAPMEQIEQKMQESSESLQKGKNGKASKQQKENADQMQDLAQKMQEMMDQATQEQESQDMASLRQILENLVSFSFEQEAIMQDFRGLQYKDPKYIQGLNQQTKAGKNFEMIRDSLYALAKTQPMIAAPINKEILIIQKELARTEESLDDRNSGKAQVSQQLVMTSTNNLALLLSEILDQMQKQQSESKKQKSGNCQNPGGGKPKPGFGQPKQQAQSIKQQMQNMLDQLKDGQGGKNGKKQTNAALGKMIAEQEKMQKMLSDLSNSEGLSPETVKQLKEIKNLSKQIEDDLIQKNISPTTLKRQELIMTRLLEAENSEYKREQDNKRESNSVINPQISNPKEIFKYKKEDLISNDLLNKQKIKLNNFYRDKYKNYIFNLHE